MAKKKDLEDILKDALVKRAIGGNAKETVDEYSCGGAEGALKLVKRKVSTKYNPPDVAAVKALLGYDGRGFEDIADDELMAERERLVREIKESEEN